MAANHEKQARQGGLSSRSGISSFPGWYPPLFSLRSGLRILLYLLLPSFGHVSHIDAYKGYSGVRRPERSEAKGSGAMPPGTLDFHLSYRE
jgi:hypothetical protein